jgi:hypothetical protein
LQTGGFLIDPAVADPDLLGFNPRAELWGEDSLAIRVLNTDDDAIIFLPRVLAVQPGCEPYATAPLQYPPLPGPHATDAAGTNTYFIAARGLAGNPVTGEVYVSIGSYDAHHPNSVIAIAPNALSPAWSRWVGSEPSVLDVTAEGDTLWVGFDGTNTLRSVDLGSATPAPPFMLGLNDRSGPVYAHKLRAVPESPGSVAALGYYHNVGSPTGYLFYDDGVERYGMVNYSTAFLRIENINARSFTFDGPERLFGMDASELMVVTATDQLTGTSLGTGIIGGGEPEMELSAFRTLVTSSGYFLDADALTALGSVEANGAMTLSADRALAYFVNDAGPPPTYPLYTHRVWCVRLDTRQVSGSFTFTVPNPTSEWLGNAVDVARWGDDGLAVRFEGAFVLIANRLSQVSGCL